MRSQHILLNAFGLLVLGRLTGVLISPFLIAHEPLLLVILSPMIANLSLVANLIPSFEYYLCALSVSLAHSCIGYFLGQSMGRRSMSWAIQRFPNQEKKLLLFTKLAKRSASLSILLVPGPFLSLVVGAVGMSFRKFLFMTCIAQTAWTFLCKNPGDTLEEYIVLIQNYIVHNSLWLTALFVGAYLLFRITITCKQR